LASGRASKFLTFSTARSGKNQQQLVVKNTLSKMDIVLEMSFVESDDIRPVADNLKLYSNDETYVDEVKDQNREQKPKPKKTKKRASYVITRIVSSSFSVVGSDSPLLSVTKLQSLQPISKDFKQTKLTHFWCSTTAMESRIPLLQNNAAEFQITNFEPACFLESTRTKFQKDLTFDSINLKVIERNFILRRRDVNFDPIEKKDLEAGRTFLGLFPSISNLAQAAVMKKQSSQGVGALWTPLQSREKSGGHQKAFQLRLNALESSGMKRVSSASVVPTSADEEKIKTKTTTATKATKKTIEQEKVEEQENEVVKFSHPQVHFEKINLPQHPGLTTMFRADFRSQRGVRVKGKKFTVQVQATLPASASRAAAFMWHVTSREMASPQEIKRELSSYHNLGSQSQGFCIVEKRPSSAYLREVNCRMVKERKNDDSFVIVTRPSSFSSRTRTMDLRSGMGGLANVNLGLAAENARKNLEICEKNNSAQKSRSKLKSKSVRQTREKEKIVVDFNESCLEIVATSSNSCKVNFIFVVTEKKLKNAKNNLVEKFELRSIVKAQRYFQKVLSLQNSFKNDGRMVGEFVMSNVGR